MKKTCLLLLLFPFCRLSAQDYLLPLVSDSSHTKYWDSFDGTLQAEYFSRQHYGAGDQLTYETFINIFSTDTSYYRYDYTYGAQNELQNYISYRSLISLNGPWENWLREDYEYDAQGRLTHYLDQVGNAGGWNDYFQETFWFDDAAKMDSSIFQLYSIGLQEWGNNSKRTRAANPDGSVRQEHQFDWDSDLNVWTPHNFDDYTYYPDGKLKTHSNEYHFNASVYDMRIDSNGYRADGKLDTVYSRYISYPSGDLYKYFAANDYDSNGNLTIATTYTIEQGVAYDDSRILYLPPDGVYSSTPASQILENFDQPTQSWKQQWQRILSFFPLANNSVLEVQQLWQLNNDGLLVLQSLDSTWYHIGMVDTHAPGSFSASCTFANPYIPGSPVVCNADDATAPLQLRLTDLVGQPVAQARAMPGEAWTPPANLGTGLYVLQVWQNGRQLGARKMIVP